MTSSAAAVLNSQERFALDELPSSDTSSCVDTKAVDATPERQPRAICVARGDGIGPEIVDATLKVLEASGARLRFEMVEMGRQASGSGEPVIFPRATWDGLRRTGILLKGPIAAGPTGSTHSVDVTVRRALGLFANVRPVRSYAPYIATNHPSMDLVVIRENEEDVSAGAEYQQTDDVVHATRVVSRQGCERLIRYAFEYTRGRQRKKLTCMTKDNVMKLTDGLFRNVFVDVAREYPDIHAELMLVDTGAARLAAQPERFDVIVVPKLYGDILAGVAAEVSGSIGMMGSAIIGKHCAVFEAVHGSAAEMAGLDVANPSGLILAAVKLLAHVGQGEAAELVHNAWLRTIEDGVHTIDVHREGRSTRVVGTSRFADAVIERLGQNPMRLRRAIYPRIPTRAPTLAQCEPAHKKMVGVDVFVQWRGSVDALATRLSRADGNALALTTITNRGLKVWPSGYPDPLNSDNWQCRYTLADGRDSLTHRDLLELLGALETLGVDFAKMETLCTFDGRASFYPREEIR